MTAYIEVNLPPVLHLLPIKKIRLFGKNAGSFDFDREEVDCRLILYLLNILGTFG